MNNRIKFYKDKLFYSDKRRKSTKNLLVSALAIICSLIVALIIAMIIYKKGSLFFKIIGEIFTIPFTSINYSKTISNITIFAVGGLGFIFAFRAGLFNIGLSGQMLFGGIVAILIGQHMVNVPNGLGQILILVISIVAAATIAGVIGALKAFFNMSEVVSSILFNWIIYFAGSYLLIACHIPTDSSGLNTEPWTVAGNNPHPNLLLNITGGPLNGTWFPLLIITIIVTAGVIVILGYTSIGRKVIHTGMSTTASQYAGFNVKLNQILAMVVSGAVAGILGAMVYCGRDLGAIAITPISKTIPQEGFNGISVGLIAMNNPWAVLPVSLFFGMIDSAKASMSVNLGVDSHISDLIFGIVVYGSAIVAIFYYIVPFKWYQKLFKGKKYVEKYTAYSYDVLKEIEDVDNVLYFIKKRQKNNIDNFGLEKEMFEKYKIDDKKIKNKKMIKQYKNYVFGFYCNRASSLKQSLRKEAK